jgi:serine-type D-Ala-D-Ala carboxypeptidase (penicillin-binding protein 5/6)
VSARNLFLAEVADPESFRDPFQVRGVFDGFVRNLLAAFAAVVAVAAYSTLGAPPNATAEPEPKGALATPNVAAPSWLIADLDTGHILSARDANTPRAPASTIKVLLALVALEQLNLNSAIVATAADTDVECSCAGVKAGHSYTALQLLTGALLVSGNDAANTLADMLGGFGVAVAKMNAKAQQLGAVNTRAATPSGLDGPGMTGLTTPHDLAVIFRAALANPVFAQLMRTPSATFPSDDGSQTGFRTLQSQNELLKTDPGMLGGKTGYTDIAGKTFVGADQRNGHRLVISFMGGGDGSDYWDQAAGMFDWGFAQYR